MLHRTTAAALLTVRQAATPASRAFSTSPLLLAKGRKSIRFNSAAPPANRATTSPGQTGTDVGQGGGAGLFEGEPEVKVEEVKPEDLEKEMLASQGPWRKDVDGQGERENLAGTDVGQGGKTVQATTAEGNAGEDGYGPEETIYTAKEPFNTPLMLTVAGTIGVFCFAIADFARVGIERYDEITGEYTQVSKTKRYLAATAAGGLGVGIVVAASLAPTRIITRMTLRRPLTSTSPYPFPPDALVSLYNPLTPLMSKIARVKPRTVPLSKMRLLGPLSDPKPYHPRFQEEAQKASRFWSFVAKLVPKPTTSKRTQMGTHSPFGIEGGKLTYSLATKRAKEPFSKDGAWCKDWEALERAMLGVDEARWAKR
ncbi:hypothetical protein JCM8547_001645 [Rhodosporidiobolus lusitaniae]